MEQWYWYQPLTEGNVRILRVYGRESRVVVPCRIAAGRVTEIGSYCFAEKEVAEDYRICSDREELKQGQVFSRLCEREGLFSLAGKNVTGVELPDTLEKIGNFAFYQCREMVELSLGMGVIEIGSDAFMNCRQLSDIFFRGNPEEISCLKQILAQRSEETMVCFLEGGQIRAMLLYPEYSEQYDLIGPAHIFELNIQGEGFRARQCFQNGVVDFGAYDRIFSLECGEDSVETLCRMACSRLQYPWKLSHRERQLYENYVAENIVVVCRKLTEEKNFYGIQTLYRSGLLTSRGLENCLEQAVSAGWTEGVRQLFSLKEREKKEGDEYAFQDF